MDSTYGLLPEVGLGEERTGRIYSPGMEGATDRAVYRWLRNPRDVRRAVV